jgi:metal-responsive CopG/Arc/MetJ family transcriptional regulator
MTDNRLIQSERFNILLSGKLKDQLTAAALARGISRSEYIRFALQQAFQKEKDLRLQKAVRELAPLYNTDPELVEFTDLDGEDFS